VSRKASGSAFLAWSWDGRSIIPHAEGIPLTDRGFRYGQHLFESIAVRNGEALLALEHLDLLAAATKRNGFALARPLYSALRRFVRSILLSDGMLRIYLTAGEGAPGAPIRHAGCYLTWEPAHFPTEAEVAKGFRLTVLKSPFLGTQWGEKSGNYAEHLTALTSARADSADEGIILDAKGHAISCAMSNLLVWIPISSRGNRNQSVLCTPPIARGARSGAVLGWVKKNTLVMELDLRRGHLKKAVAMAVTNSRLGVMPVSSLDGVILQDLPLSLELSHSYLEHHGLLRRS
jgi:branched-subunit amino acid aminotransferase/4-amino-4-deoxychorismate lyase